MRRYATIFSFSGYNPDEERRIKKLFEKIFKTNKVRIAFNARELSYYVATEDEVKDNEKV